MMKVLGLSGGADSVFLFHFLLEQKNNFRCIYVNHKMNIHDEDAERFCRELCASHGIQLKVIDVNKPLKNETQARQVRYEAFKEDVQQDELILGHHVDDVVETMLMNLCKGSSLNGMSGIATSGEVYGIRFHRPLIELKYDRNAIQASLTERCLKWYEDDTNQDNTIPRNHIRNVVIPALQTLFPDCVDKIVDFGENCKVANKIVNTYMGDNLNSLLSTQQEINGTDIQRFWFFNWMKNYNIMASKRHYNEFVAFVGNQQYKEMSLPDGMYIAKAINSNNVLCLYVWRR